MNPIVRVWCGSCGRDLSERAGCNCGEPVDVVQIGCWVSTPAPARQVRYARILRALIGLGLSPSRASSLAETTQLAS